jgi:hypothetical protein
MSTTNSNKKVALQTSERSQKHKQQQQQKSKATTSARLLLHDLVSLTTPVRENQRQNVFENTRESQEKKEIMILISSNQDLSSLLFSPLSSSSSSPSLNYNSAAFLLQATLLAESNLGVASPSMLWLSPSCWLLLVL